MMDCMSRDDLQIISHKINTPPRSPFLAALLRRQSRNEHLSEVKFKEQRRIVVLGSANVGKSALIQQFLYDRFLPRYRKTVEDLYMAEYNFSSGASLTLEILDTAGAFEFPAMRALSISNGNAFLLVYSVDNEESFEEVKRLRKEIISCRGPSIPIVIAANKIGEAGVERVVKREDVDKAVKRWHCGYMECNVKQNINIINVFSEVLLQLNIRYDLNEAVCRRRKSFPVYTGHRRINQANLTACTIS